MSPLDRRGERASIYQSNKGVELVQCASEAFRRPHLVSGTKRDGMYPADANTLCVQSIDYGRDIAKDPPMLFLVPAVFSSRSITLFSVSENADDIAPTSLLNPFS